MNKLKGTIRVVAAILELALCWYAFLYILDGSAELFHYGILIGVAVDVAIFIIKRFRAKE